MLPLIASLFQLGMPVIANAILSKGQDAVEQHLGVKIGDLVGTDEGRIKLKQLEVQNEEGLRNFALAKAELELKGDKMYLEDVDSARKMQQSALAQDDLFSKRFVYYFAIFWSLMSCAYIGFITFGTIPESNIRFADTILGFVLGTLVATIINFFFGSAKGSRDKDTGLLAALKGLTK